MHGATVVCVFSADPNDINAKSIQNHVIPHFFAPPAPPRSRPVPRSPHGRDGREPRPGAPARRPAALPPAPRPSGRPRREMHPPRAGPPGRRSAPPPTVLRPSRRPYDAPGPPLGSAGGARAGGGRGGPEKHPFHLLFVPWPRSGSARRNGNPFSSAIQASKCPRKKTRDVS